VPINPSAGARIVAAGTAMVVRATEPTGHGALLGMQYTGAQTIYLVAPAAGGVPVWLAEDEIEQITPAWSHQREETHMSSVTPYDWIGIADVVAGLAHAQDDKDWGRFQQLFADPVTLDQSTKSGEPAVTMSAEELTALARRVLDGFPCTHHASSTPLIEVDGDTATCRTHMVAFHHLPTDGVDFCTMRGYWELDLVRSGGRWLIRRWAVVRTAPWEGDPDLYRLAREGEQHVVRDPS